MSHMEKRVGGIPSQLELKENDWECGKTEHRTQVIRQLLALVHRIVVFLGWLTACQHTRFL